MPLTPSAPELGEALEKIAPDLEALSREAEIERRPPSALATLLKKARLPMAKVPKVVGGYELPPAEQVDYFARIAYLNPTAGWLSFNQNGSAGMAAATLPEDGVAQLFATDSPLFAAVSAPTGKSQRVDGGYRVSGRWSYASGIHVADWVLLMTICDDPAGPLFVVLPRTEVSLHDNWHVAALQGTGSVDVEVDDVFVSRELTASPLTQVRGGSQYLKLGYRGYVAGENVGFSLGVAQRLVDEIAGMAPTKRRILAPSTLGERGAFQAELGRTDAALRAARAYAMAELRLATDTAEQSDRALDETELAQLGACVGFATESIVQSGMRLFPYAGASALHLSNPIQRAFRDLVGSGQHLVATNETLEEWGRALLAPKGTAT